jgi:HEAT repeat protein
MVYLTRTPIKSEARVQGRTLREWTIWLDDESEEELRESAWTALPQFPAAEAAGRAFELLGSNNQDTRDRAVTALVSLKSGGRAEAHHRRCTIPRRSCAAARLIR